MDVFKCIHCGGTELGGFRFDAVDEEGNDCVVDIFIAPVVFVQQMRKMLN